MLKTISLSIITDSTPHNTAFSRSNNVAKFIYQGTDPVINNALRDLLRVVQVSRPEDSFFFKTIKGDTKYFTSGIPSEHVRLINTYYISSFTPNQTFYLRGCTAPNARFEYFKKNPHYFFDPGAVSLINPTHYLCYVTSNSISSPSSPIFSLHHTDNLFDSKKIGKNPATCFNLKGELELHSKLRDHPLTLVDLIFFEIQLRNNLLSITSDKLTDYTNHFEQTDIHSRASTLMLELETYYFLAVGSLPFTEIGKYHFLIDILTGHHHILNHLYAAQYNESLISFKYTTMNANYMDSDFRDMKMIGKGNPYLLMRPSLPTLSPENLPLSDTKLVQSNEYKKVSKALGINLNRL